MGLDANSRKKAKNRRGTCDMIMKVFEKKVAKEDLVPESRSLKMQNQLRKDKLMQLLSVFESSLV